MRRIFLALTVTAIVIACTSCAFAYDEAREAMITYSGTDAFARLLPEERQACMYWVSEGGRMSETCRSAVVRLISEDPEAVTPSQRRALLAAASGKVSASTSPAPSEKPKTVEKYDNTGAIIAAGVIGVVAGMVIHNNLPRDRETHHHHHHVPPPPRPYRYPAPHRVPHHHRY